jgi:hypothetical protein
VVSVQFENGIVLEGKLKSKRKLQVATLLAFVALVLYVNLETDIETVGKLVGYAVLIMIPLAFLAWKYKDKLNQLPKGIVGLIIAGSLFFWRWLHSVSFTAEMILAFSITLVGIVISFIIDEKDIKLE